MVDGYTPAEAVMTLNLWVVLASGEKSAVPASVKVRKNRIKNERQMGIQTNGRLDHFSIHGSSGIC